MSNESRASASGLRGEKIVKTVLDDHSVPYRKQYTFPDVRGIYGRRMRTDFLLEHPRYPIGIAVEVRWQNIRGTADEKLPYLVLNIKNSFPVPCIIVLDGAIRDEGVINFMRERIDKEKLVAVMSLGEFTRWIDDNYGND